MVPANRIGHSVLLSLTVFLPLLLIYMKQPLTLNYVWAALCIFGAVFFIFRS